MWRNWQTRWLQVPVGVTPWRFESSHPQVIPSETFRAVLAALSHALCEPYAAPGRGIPLLSGASGRPIHSSTPEEGSNDHRSRASRCTSPARVSGQAQRAGVPASTFGDFDRDNDGELTDFAEFTRVSAKATGLDEARQGVLVIDVESDKLAHRGPLFNLVIGRQSMNDLSFSPLPGGLTVMASVGTKAMGTATWSGG